MQLMTLCASKGMEMSLTADGDDAEALIDTVAEVNTSVIKPAGSNVTEPRYAYGNACLWPDRVRRSSIRAVPPGMAIMLPTATGSVAGGNDRPSAPASSRVSGS